MRTKTSVFCDGVMEGGWLFALILAPLFFNVYSSRVFEPDKLGLVRTLATLVALAWLVKKGEELTERRPDTPAEPGALDRFLRLPLVLPTLLLSVVYLLATATSVVGRVSLWGSYQRLQGTYSMLSYIVIFLVMLQTLRRSEQLQRLLTTITLTSLAPALYGVLQHYGMDPLPWGGDVVERVASNMGNPIFIGAYLIMVLPLTLAKVIQLQSAAFEGLKPGARTALSAGFWALLVVQTIAWAFVGFDRGLLAGLLLIGILGLVAAYLGRPLARYLLLGCYSLALSVQATCILFTQSRGPFLGLFAGLFFFGLLYMFARRWRAAAITVVAIAGALFVFLWVMALPGSPLAGAKQIKYVGRLADVFDVAQGTGKVRVLIWEGAVDMLKANPLRSLIGYGPESMYVAYNPYYPPDLAHYEARNASPDRSHNETFDALLTTGVLGFLVYMFLFSSLFYYGLRWLGLIRSRGQSRFFAGCSLVGSVVGIAIPIVVDRSWRFVGVGLPLGFIAGLSVYVTVSALVSILRARPDDGGTPPLQGWRLLLLVALVSGVVAHFVEIHFGIAIASTRTYFWAFAALLVLVGEGMVSTNGEHAAQRPAEAARAPAVAGADRARMPVRAKSRRRQHEKRPAPSVQPAHGGPTQQLVALAVIAGMIAITVVWDYTTNPLGDRNPMSVLMTSLTTLAAKRMPDKTSLGMLAVVLATFVVSVLTVVAEVASLEPRGRRAEWWAYALGIATMIAGWLGLLFGLVHAARLGPGVEPSDLIYGFYAAVLIVLLGLATVLYLGQPRPRATVSGALSLGYVATLVAALLVANWANIRIVKADVLYKNGLKFDSEGAWDNAIGFYGRAVELCPAEDFYYLFYGRATMERAKQERDLKAREVFFDRALTALVRARDLNPLNTDHTANMGRLYRTWAEMDDNAAKRSEKLQRSLQAYEAATRLSPHNAQLYNEWGLVYYLMGDYVRAQAKYDESLVLDKQFGQTYILIGDLHLARKEWTDAARAYEQAVAMDPGFVQGWSAIGYAYSQLGEWEGAITANLKVLDLSPKDYGTLKNLAILYNQTNRPQQALPYAERALALAPQQDKPTLESFVTQLRAKQGGGN